MDCAAIHTWSGMVPGREKEALDYAAEASAYWSKLVAEGKCSEPEMFFSGTRGTWMVKGDPDTLRELYAREETQVLAAKGGFLLQDWDYEFAITGNAAAEYLLRVAAAGQGLGYV